MSKPTLYSKRTIPANKMQSIDSSLQHLEEPQTPAQDSIRLPKKILLNASMNQSIASEFKETGRASPVTGASQSAKNHDSDDETVRHKGDGHNESLLSNVQDSDEEQREIFESIFKSKAIDFQSQAATAHNNDKHQMEKTSGDPLKDAFELKYKDKDGRIILHRAALMQNTSLFQQMFGTSKLDHSELKEVINETDNYGNTPLNLVMVYDVESKRGARIDCLDYLLKHEADPNVHNTTLWTPLHWAARYGDKQAVDMLLGKQAYVYAREKKSLFPIDLAGYFGHEKCVQQLLKHTLMQLLSDNIKQGSLNLPKVIAQEEQDQHKSCSSCVCCHSKQKIDIEQNQNKNFPALVKASLFWAKQFEQNDEIVRLNKYLVQTNIKYELELMTEYQNYILEALGVQYIMQDPSLKNSAGGKRRQTNIFDNYLKQQVAAEAQPLFGSQISHQPDEKKQSLVIQRSLPLIPIVAMKVTANEPEIINQVILTLTNSKFNIRMFQAVDPNYFYLLLDMDQRDLEIEAENVKIKIGLIGINHKKAYQVKLKASFQPFSSGDKANIMHDVVHRLINIEQLMQQKYVLSIYPIHNQKEIKDIQDRFVKQPPKGLLQPLPIFGKLFKEGSKIDYMELKTITTYFGEKGGIYFAWVSFYTAWLVIPAFFGLALTILQIITSYFDTPIIGIYATIVVLWATIFIERWKRKMSEICLKWGVYKDITSTKKLINPKYAGNEEFSFLSHQVITKSGSIKGKLFFALSIIICFFLILCCVGIFFGTQEIKTRYGCSTLTPSTNNTSSNSTLNSTAYNNSNSLNMSQSNQTQLNNSTNGTISNSTNGTTTSNSTARLLYQQTLNHYFIHAANTTNSTSNTTDINTSNNNTSNNTQPNITSPSQISTTNSSSNITNATQPTNQTITNSSTTSNQTITSNTTNTTQQVNSTQQQNNTNTTTTVLTQQSQNSSLNTSSNSANHSQLYYTIECQIIQTGAGVINGISISIFNFIYQMLASMLLKLENHKYLNTSESSLIYKLFIFKFINTYISLFYVAFYIQDFTQLYYLLVGMILQKSLLILFLSKTTIKMLRLWVFKKLYFRNARKLALEQAIAHTNFLDNQKKIAPQKYMQYDEQRKEVDLKPVYKDAEITEQNPLMFRAILNVKQRREPEQWLVDEVELTSYMAEQTDEVSINEQSDQFIMFGFGVFFAAACPIAALLIIVHNIIDIRFDLYVQCYHARRPFKQQRSNMSHWLIIMEFIAIMAVITNSLLIVLSSSQLKNYLKQLGLDTDVAFLWCIVIIEHIIIFSKICMTVVINDYPAWVDKENQKIQHREETLKQLETTQKDRQKIDYITKMKHAHKGLKKKNIEAAKKMRQELKDKQERIAELEGKYEKDTSPKKKGDVMKGILDAWGANDLQSHKSAAQTEIEITNNLIFGLLKSSFHRIENEIMQERIAKLYDRIQIQSQHETGIIGGYNMALESPMHQQQQPNNLQQSIRNKQVQSSSQWKKFEQFNFFPIDQKGNPDQEIQFHFGILKNQYIDENYVTDLEHIKTTASKLGDNEIEAKKKIQLDRASVLIRKYEKQEPFGQSATTTFQQKQSQVNMNMMRQFNDEERYYMNRVAFYLFKQKNDQAVAANYVQIIRRLQEETYEKKCMLWISIMDIDNSNEIMKEQLVNVLRYLFVQDQNGQSHDQDIINKIFEGNQSKISVGELLHMMYSDPQIKLFMRCILQDY